MKYTHCQECCAKIFEWQDLFFADGMMLCSQCYDDTFTCEECRDNFFNADNAGNEDKPLCEKCFAAHYHRCTCCDEVVHKDDTVWWCNEPYCHDCYLENNEEVS